MNIFYESEDSSKDQNLSLKRGFKSNIHSCFKCNKVFKKLAYLKEHEYVHTGERPFKCLYPKCEISYKRKDHLKRHVIRMHEKEETADVRCEFEGCGKSYSSKCSLEKHVNSYHANKYKCSQCGESFNKKHKLRHHEFTHKGVLPFQCDTCKKQFSQGSHLRRHIKVHQGYKCESCDAVYAKWSQLRKHKAQIHRKEHQCQRCTKVFHSNVQLRKHMQHCGTKTGNEESATEEYTISCDDDLPKQQCYTINDVANQSNTYIKIPIHSSTSTMVTEQSKIPPSSSQASVKKFATLTPLSNNIFYKKITLHKDSQLLENEVFKDVFTNRNEQVYKDGSSTKNDANIPEHVSQERRVYYSCTYNECNKKYTQHRNLLNHIRVHHLNLLHICIKCRNTFSSKQKLKNHGDRCGIVANMKRKVVKKKGISEQLKKSLQGLKRRQEMMKHKYDKDLKGACEGTILAIRRNKRRMRKKLKIHENYTLPKLNKKLSLSHSLLLNSTQSKHFIF